MLLAYLCDAFRISNSVIPTGLDVSSEVPPYLLSAMEYVDYVRLHGIFARALL